MKMSKIFLILFSFMFSQNYFNPKIIELQYTRFFGQNLLYFLQKQECRKMENQIYNILNDMAESTDLSLE